MGRKTQGCMKFVELRPTIALGLVLFSRSSLCQVAIQVVSRPHLSIAAQWCSSPVECLVKGSLTDELGVPLSNRELHGAIDTQKLPSLINNVGISSCGELASPAAMLHDHDLAVRTSETGEFCFHVESNALPPDARVHITYSGEMGYDAVQSWVALAGSGSLTSLKVLESPDPIAIDSDKVVIAVQLTANDRAAVAQLVTLALLEPTTHTHDSKETHLATSRTDSNGVARFHISGGSFGPVGMAQLFARFESSESLPGATMLWPIFRTCQAQLQIRLASGEIEVGDDVNIVAIATSKHGVVPEGLIEFLVDQSTQVALPLVQGKARWALPTQQFAPGDLHITLRYLPASAAWASAANARAILRVKPVSPGRQAVWLASGLLMIGWLVFRWLRSDRDLKSLRSSPPRASDTQSLEVEPSSHLNSGWQGIVIDSHTNLPIMDADVAIERRGFEGKLTECQTATSNEGTFVLPPVDSLQSVNLVVSAATYLGARWAMPTPGKLVIRLETRRRAIVRSFLSWTENFVPRNMPTPDPTPAQVAESARGRKLWPINNWAMKVENAAFGPIGPAAQDEELLLGPTNSRSSAKSPE
jgi:hypothetical protein